MVASRIPPALMLCALVLGASSDAEGARQGATPDEGEAAQQLQLGLARAQEGDPRGALPHLEAPWRATSGCTRRASIPTAIPDSESLSAFGATLQSLGQPGRAMLYLERATVMRARHVEKTTLFGAETSALAFADSLAELAILLSAARSVPGSDVRAYAAVWDSKAAVSRAQRIREAVARGSGDPRVREKVAELQEVRRRLERAAAAAGRGPGG